MDLFSLKIKYKWLQIKVVCVSVFTNRLDVPVSVCVMSGMAVYLCVCVMWEIRRWCASMCGNRPGGRFDRRPVIEPEHRSSQRCSSETWYITFIFRTRSSCAHNRTLSLVSVPGRVRPCKPKGSSINYVAICVGGGVVKNTTLIYEGWWGLRLVAT